MKKFIKIMLFIIALLIAFILGVVVEDIPRLSIDTKIRISEPIIFLLTVSIGLLMPFFIKRWIDDSRQVKNNLIEELRDTLREVACVKLKIKLCYSQKKINQGDKQEIIALFEEADLKMDCLEQLFKETFDDETKKIRQEIRQEYIDYWNFTTNETMSIKFKVVTENYYKQHNERFVKFETKIKQAINKIHRF